MKIKEKQYNLLTRLLKEYTLNKDIEYITPFEASVVIEGILNKGTVKNTYNGKVLSDIDYNKKQAFFNNLVTKKSPYANERQMEYIRILLEATNYELINPEVLKQDVNPLVTFLKGNGSYEYVAQYLQEKEPLKLIKIKDLNHSVAKIDLPEDWIMQDIEINGIIDFKKRL